MTTYGQMICTLPPEAIRNVESIRIKLCNIKLSITFNKICLRENLLPIYTLNIYIYHHHHHQPFTVNCSTKASINLFQDSRGFASCCQVAPAFFSISSRHLLSGLLLSLLESSQSVFCSISCPIFLLHDLPISTFVP